MSETRTAWFQHRLAAVSEGICPIHNGRLVAINGIGQCEDGGEGWTVHRTADDDPLFHGQVVVTNYQPGHTAMSVAAVTETREADL